MSPIKSRGWLLMSTTCLSSLLVWASTRMIRPCALASYPVNLAGR
jgi:hypothetical protein